MVRRGSKGFHLEQSYKGVHHYSRTEINDACRGVVHDSGMKRLRSRYTDRDHDQREGDA
jgi:hypothetical protein